MPVAYDLTRAEVRVPSEGIRRALRRGYCRLRRLSPPARFPPFIAEKK